jgi:hypothetical protein
MRRFVVFGVLAWGVAACSDSARQPTALRPARVDVSAASLSAPAPSPIVPVSLPGQTLQLWPFTGFGFGEKSDPVNLIFIGQADPRALRAALLLLDGDRSAFGFPNVFPFNCTWHDDPEVQTEVAYTTGSGWVGSPIMLECGVYDEARFHLRFFDVGGGATVGGVPFEVYIPGTLEHQTISWELAEQFVTVDFIRSGLLDLNLPLFSTDPITPAPSFDAIPALIYNGIPTALRGAIGGPLGDVTDPVPIANDGRATVLNLSSAVEGERLVSHRQFVEAFDQVIPQPFCGPGSATFLFVQGPVTFNQQVVFTPSGNYLSDFHAEGQLDVTPVDPTTGQPVGATYRAVVLEDHKGILTDAVTLSTFFTLRITLPPSAPFHGRLEFEFAVGPAGMTRTSASVRCGS